MNKYLLFILLICCVFKGYPQKIKLSGTIKDSISTPIVFANIMAETPDKSEEMRFAMSDTKGNYTIRLLAHKQYVITYTSLGYATQKIVINTDSTSIQKNITLSEQTESLGKLVIKAKQPPVIINEDSIAYKTEKFVNGNERKLKDVLKKLPGIQVSSNGNVTVMGKKVTKVFVDGKEFFSGDSKLAVNNIPADAIKKVVAIKDYTSVSFMKGLTDQQKMILNIKLKKGKKHFVFGDIETGAEIKNHHSLKANLFYYSPKTNLNYLGNHNNIGEAPMDFMDFIRLETYDEACNKGIKQSYRQISGFMFTKDFVKQINNFHALQWQQDFGKKITFNTYGIFSINKTQKLKESDNFYYSNIFKEYQVNNTNISQAFKYFKGHLKYRISTSQYIDYHFLYNDKNLNNDKLIYLKNNYYNNYTNDYQDIKNKNTRHNFAYYNRINRKHTFRLLANYESTNNSPKKNWQTKINSFTNILPVLNQNKYNIFQNNNLLENNFNFELKDFWKINGKNHIYTSLGGKILNQKYKSVSYQKLEDNSINSFSTKGFGNDLKIYFSDIYFGLQYKFKWHKTIFKPGMYTHYLKWNFSPDNIQRKKYYYLPDLKISIKPNSRNEIEFSYKLKTSISDLQNYMPNYSILGLNELSKGNLLLENELLHAINIDYNYFKMKNGTILFVFLEYINKIQSIHQDISILENNIVKQSVLLKTPENQLTLSGSFRTVLNKKFIELSFSDAFYELQESINQQKENVSYFSQYYDLSIGSLSKKINDFRLGIKFSNMASFATKTTVNNELEPYLNFDLPYKAFTLKGKYSYKFSKNITENNSHLASIAIAFQKENSAWRFETDMTNIFNNRTTQSYVFNNYFHQTITNYQQPRMIVFKINYNL